MLLVEMSRSGNKKKRESGVSRFLRLYTLEAGRVSVVMQVAGCLFALLKVASLLPAECA